MEEFEKRINYFVWCVFIVSAIVSINIFFNLINPRQMHQEFIDDGVDWAKAHIDDIGEGVSAFGEFINPFNWAW